MQIKIDPEELTFRDLRDMEQVTGKPAMGTLSRYNEQGAGALMIDEYMSLIWVIGRRGDPTLTYDDVLDSKIVEADITVPPVDAGGRSANGSRPSQSRSRGAGRNSSKR